MAKYSYEQRLEAVLNVTEKHMSPQAAADLLGTAREHVRRWVKRYEQFGTEGLLLKKGTYAGKFKISVVEYMHTHQISVSEAAVIFGIPKDSTVGAWERIYYEEGRESLLRETRGRKKMTDEPKPRKPKLHKRIEEDLIAANQRLRMEVAYLKKLNALIQAKEKSAAKKR